MKLTRYFKGRVKVEDVIERKFLALDLLRGRKGAGRERARRVEGRLLVRVFAVSQVLYFFELEGEGRRKVRVFFTRFFRERAEPVGYRAVVARGQLKGLLREPEPRLNGKRSACFFHLGCYQSVVFRVGHAGDVFKVFCRGPYHGRAADVYVFDRINEGPSALYRLLERVEVHDHHVYRGYAVIEHLFRVRRVFPHAEYAAVDFRVKRFYPSVQHLG